MNRVLGLMTCFNRKNETIRAIKDLITGNPDVTFHFLIVDDNSSDGTKDALLKIPEVTVFSGNGSLFYSGGMHLIMEEALRMPKIFDYCLLFNDDVHFYPHVIEEMIKQNNNGILVGATCNNEGQLSYGGVIKTSKLRPSFKIINWTSSRANNCDTFNANCVLIPWEIFLNLGSIDPIYTHSLGDFDYGFSAIKKGYSISVFDKYVGICCDNPIKNSWRDISLNSLVRFKKKESPKGLPRKEWFYYLKKNYSLFTAIVYSVIPYIKILIGK